jgi:hypothetical protein
MRTCLAFLFALSSVVLRAEPTPTPAPAGPTESVPTVEEIQTIRKILELPPERLARVRSAIEKIERMSPESRRGFAGSLARFEAASPEERRRMMKEMRDRGGFGSMRALELHFKSLDPAAVKAERARIHGLTPEQRAEFMRELTERHAEELAKERVRPVEPKEGPGKRRRPADGETPSRGR